MEKLIPQAWMVVRNCPGFSDHGKRIGLFWKESEADDWIDDIHIKIPLYTLEDIRNQNIENILSDGDK